MSLEARQHAQSVQRGWMGEDGGMAEEMEEGREGWRRGGWARWG